MENVGAGYGVQYEDYVKEKEPRFRHETSRFCNDNLDVLKQHFHSFIFCSGEGVCIVCGGHGAYWKCGECGQRMHFKQGREQTKVTCAADYHNESFFGLAFCDRHLVGLPRENWSKPTPAQRKENAAHIAGLRKKFWQEKWAQEELWS